MAELARVLRPGGMLAVSVPRYGPELVNWALSERYHSVAGGHVRIYRRRQLLDAAEGGGPESWSPPITPTPSTAPTGGSGAWSEWRTRTVSPFAAITGSSCGTSRPTRLLPASPRRLLNPFLGKSLVVYLRHARAMITPSRQVPGGRLIAETIDSIRAVQLQDGMIPWFAGRPRGPVEPRRGLPWRSPWAAPLKRQQSAPTNGCARPSVPTGRGTPTTSLADRSKSPASTPTSAHIWRPGCGTTFSSRATLGFLEELWPSVERAIDFVVSWQRPGGELVVVGRP